MTTISLHQAGVRRLGVLTDADGAQLRIDAGSACIPIDGTAITLEGGATGFEFRVSGPAMMLPPGLYPLSIWTQTGGDWAHRAQHNLHIIGGC
ncbi:MAG: hypothetical protein MEQ74_03995 [Paracoccus sp.]|nr:hypothetical protein [Paracoccus sp. (in: a-proteobacteria)]